MDGMRLAVLLLLLCAPGWAEFFRLEVEFQGIGCVSCLDSLPRRLERSRGVESVEVDAEKSVVTLRLQAGNRVRLGTVLSKITQDGTKVMQTKVVAVGVVAESDRGSVFVPKGLSRKYLLEGDNDGLEVGGTYRIQGVVPVAEAGEGPVLRIGDVRPEPAGE
jgi:copper chaperone CopZ